MVATKLNKTSTRHYWDYFLELADPCLKPLFYPDNLSGQDKKHIFKNFVCIVNLETSAYCNRKCLYCPVSINNRRKIKEYMSNELFNKVINELAGIEYASTIVFNLYNEPLADKNIFAKIESVRKSLPQSFLMFNTNGDYVDKEVLGYLQQAGLNALFVTLHPPANKSYETHGRHKDLAKLLKKIGINDVEIHQNPSNDNFEVNIDWQGMRLRIMANNWFEYGNSRAGEIDFLNKPTIRTTPCARPLRELTISYTGDVLPCCQFFPESEGNSKYIIDNISANSIFDIYASSMLASWRRNLFVFGEKKSPCDSCGDEDFSKANSSTRRLKILERVNVNMEIK